MRIRLLAATAALSAVLTGCATIDQLSSDDPEVRAAAAARVDAIKGVGLATLHTMNAAGVDWLNLDPKDPKDAVHLATGIALCGLGTGLTTVYRPEAPELSEAGANACDLILQAVQKSPFAVPPSPEATE